MWNSIYTFFATMPDFLLEACLSLIITIVGGIVVAYFVSRYFERINEVTRLKGLIIKKRIEIYKELAKKLESLNNMLFFHPDQVSSELIILSQVGFERQFRAGVKISDIFNDNETLQNRFLDFENFSLENRLFYDADVYDEVNYLQNYLCLYTHIQILFTEKLNAMGKDPGSKDNKILLNHVVRAVGILLSDDFGNCISKSIETIRSSLLNISLNMRHEQLHTYEYYNNPDGPFMQRMMSTEAGQNRGKILSVVHAYAILAK